MAHIITRTGIGKQPPNSPLYLDVGGPVNFDSTLSVIGNISVFSIIASQLATNSEAFTTNAPGDSSPQFLIRRDGLLLWGTGLAAGDTNLYRHSAATLATDHNFRIASNLLVLQNTQLDGNVVLGATPAQTIAANGYFTTSLIPSSGDAFDLGTSALRWRDLNISGNSIIGLDPTKTLNLQAQLISSIIPNTNNLYDLGQDALKWREIHAGTLLKNTGNTILGDNPVDTISLIATINTDTLPTTSNTYNLGSNSLKWASLFLGSNLQVDGNSTLGDDESIDTVTLNSRIINNFLPATDDAFDIGSISNKWRNLYLSGSLDIDGPSTFLGDVTFGDSSSDTVTFVSTIDSDFIPAIDNTYDIGSTTLRWKTLHVGPGSVIVHNDVLDTQKVALQYTGTTAQVLASASPLLQITNDANLGLNISSAGLVGVNKNTALSAQLDVDGDVAASDTIFANKTVGTSLFVKNILSLEGSIEAENAVLNVGVTNDTEIINIGTSLTTQVINLGTSSGQTIINIGSVGDIININGTTTFSQVVDTSVRDKTFVLNAGGGISSSGGTGLFVEEAGSTLLSATEAIWQSGTTVRYLMPALGNIAIGNLVTITGFINSSNNGTFVVSGTSPGVYIDVIGVRTDDTDDEVAAAQVTNPVLLGGIEVVGSRDAWELFSPLHTNNVFRFKNLGTTTELRAESGSLWLGETTSFVPSSAGYSLGLTANRWNLFSESSDINDLLVNNNTITENLQVNAISSFFEIGSNLIPTFDDLYNIGSITNKWKDLFLAGSLSVSSITADSLTINIDLLVDGNTTLGDDALVDTVTFNSTIASHLVPNGVQDLGSSTAPWNNLYTNNLFAINVGEHEVVYGSATGQLVSSVDFTFEFGNLRIGSDFSLSVVPTLDLSKSSNTSLRLYNDNNNNGLSLIGGNNQVQYSSSLSVRALTNYINLADPSAAHIESFSLDSNGMFSSKSAFAFKYGNLVSANYIVADSDTIIPVNSAALASDAVITLPSAAVPRILIIKDVGNRCSEVNKRILLSPAAGEGVEFEAVDASYVIDVDGASITLHSNGTNRWYII